MISIILHIIAIVISILLILLLCLLAIPFEYNFDGYVNESIYGKGIVKWLFGLTRFTVYKEKEESNIKVKFSLCGFGLPVNKSKNDNKKNNKKNKNKDKKKDKRKSSQRKTKITKKLIGICYEYFKDIVNIIKPRYINVSGVYGFDDPSITGIVCGIISIINSTIPNSIINVEPEFEDEVYDLKVNVSGRIIGFVILFRTLRFIMNKEVRKNIFSKKEKNVKPLKA